jgi:hypothetical protein
MIQDTSVSLSLLSKQPLPFISQLLLQLNAVGVGVGAETTVNGALFTSTIRLPPESYWATEIMMLFPSGGDVEELPAGGMVQEYILVPTTLLT